MFKNLGIILKYGVKVNWLWTIIVSSLFAYEIIETGSFIMTPWVVIVCFSLVALSELVTIIANRKLTEIFKVYAEHKPDEANTAWFSWQLSHALIFIYIISSFIAVKTTNIISIYTVASMFTWWLLYFQMITRAYWNRFTSRSHKYLIIKVNEEIKKLKDKNND